MTKPVVTAVGRLLKPKGKEKRVYSVIEVRDGQAQEIIRAEMPRD